MAFPEQAESWRAKAHLSGVRLPVLVGVTALAVLVLVVAGGALVRAATSEGFSLSHDDGALASDEGEAGMAGEAHNADGEAGAGAAEEAAKVVVHVGGAVAEPGVRELSEGARVQDAVDAAGGFAEGAARDALNLARVLADGEQVVVPTEEEAQEAGSGASGTVGAVGTAGESGGSGATGGKVNINTASVEELDGLPGVGPSTARKIAADREANGPFRTVEDLKRVSGIGDKKFAELADLVCVG